MKELKEKVNADKFQKWNKKFLDAIKSSMNPKTGMPAKKIIVILEDYEDLPVEMSRRDLTFAVVSFLVGLYDLQKKFKSQWFYFRDVIKYCKSEYNFTPSDYSILAWWGLAESENGIEAKNWRITKLGEDFLNGYHQAPLFKYSVPHSGKKITSQKFFVCYVTLEAEYMKKKNIKEPYFKP